MKLIQENGFTIIKVPKKNFKLEFFDKRKKSGTGNYINATFFGGFDDTGYTPDGSSEHFTLPIGPCICDISKNNTCAAAYHYSTNSDRGYSTYEGTKSVYNSYKYEFQNPFYGKETTCFIVDKDYNISIRNITEVDSSWRYCVCGIPCLQNSQDVAWKTYVSKQGWDYSSLRATTHNFLGMVKGDTENVYLMSWKSTTSNLIYSAEFYNAVTQLSLKFTDVIKLDGGGSFIMRSETLGINSYTSEDRQINCIIRFDDISVDPEPDPTPTIPTEELKALDDKINKLRDDMNAGFDVVDNNSDAIYTALKSTSATINTIQSSIAGIYSALDSFKTTIDGCLKQIDLNINNN